LSLCITKHHTIKTYWVRGGTAPRILNLVTWWIWAVSFTPGRFTPRVRTLNTDLIEGWVGSRANMFAHNWSCQELDPGRQSHNLVPTLTELPQLLHEVEKWFHLTWARKWVAFFGLLMFAPGASLNRNSKTRVQYSLPVMCILYRLHFCFICTEFTTSNMFCSLMWNFVYHSKGRLYHVLRGEYLDLREMKKY